MIIDYNGGYVVLDHGVPKATSSTEISADTFEYVARAIESNKAVIIKQPHGSTPVISGKYTPSMNSIEIAYITWNEDDLEWAFYVRHYGFNIGTGKYFTYAETSAFEL